MAFTKLGIDRLKTKEKRYELWEGGNRGFGIRVYPTGTKTWLYKYTIDGKRKVILLGSYGNTEPALSIEDARTIHAEKEALVNKGIDPARIKQEEIRRQREAPTVDDLIKRYLKNPKDKKGRPLRDKTVAEYTRMLQGDLSSSVGWMKVEDVKKRHIRDTIEEVEERAGNAARQLFKVCRRMFNYAVEVDWLEVSPMAGMPVMGSEGRKDRTLTPEEIKTLWEGLEEASMSDDIKRSLKLILLTAQRPGEVIGAHSSEFSGNWWTIPAERAKNKRAHTVFLTKRSKELFNPDKEGNLFPSPRGDKPIDVNALSKALRRAMSGKDNKKAEPTIKIAPFTPHDLRRTAATQIAKLGFGAYVDKVLNHTDTRVTAVYDLYDYDKEKQKALQAWDRKLNAIVTDEKADNVIPMTKRK